MLAAGEDLELEILVAKQMMWDMKWKQRRQMLSQAAHGPWGLFFYNTDSPFQSTPHWPNPNDAISKVLGEEVIRRCKEYHYQTFFFSQVFYQPLCVINIKAEQ